MNPRTLGRGITLGALLSLPALSLACADQVDAAYTIEAPVTAAHVKQEALATLSIKPGPGRHFNAEFPIALKLTSTAEVAAPNRLDRASDGVKVAEGGATFLVKLTPSSAGKKSVTGTLSFAVCTATTCEPKRVPVKLDLDVK